MKSSVLIFLGLQHINKIQQNALHTCSKAIITLHATMPIDTSTTTLQNEKSARRDANTARRR